MSKLKNAEKNMIQNLRNMFVFNPLRKNNNNLINLEERIDTKKRSYVRGPYRTWDQAEIRLLQDKIQTSMCKNLCVNLSEIQEFLTNRSVSSIRCKVRELLIKRGLQYLGTCTVKNTKGNKNGRTIK